MKLTNIKAVLILALTTMIVAISWSNICENPIWSALFHRENSDSTLVPTVNPSTRSSTRNVPRSPLANDSNARKNYVDSDTDQIAQLAEVVENRVRRYGGLEALKYFRGLPFGDERSLGLTSALLAISRENGIIVSLDIINKLSPRDVQDSTVTNLFVPQEASDLFRVISGLDLLTDPRLRSLAINQIAESSRIFKQDDILQVMNSQELTETQKRVAEFCYSLNMVKSDPVAVAEKFEMFDRSQKQALFEQIISNWPVSSLDEGATWLFSNCHDQTTLQTSLWAMIKSNVGKYPDKLMAIIANAPPSQIVDEAHGLLADMIFDSDPDAARAWADSLPFGFGRSNAIKSIVGRLMQENPIFALDFVQESSRGSDDNVEQLRWIGHLWAQKDPEAALAWVENTGVVTEGDRNKINTAILQAWAMSDPEEFVKKAESNRKLISNGAVVETLYQSYRKLSIHDAADWLVVNNFATTERISGLVSNWIRSSPVDASNWISQLDNGEVRNVAVTALVSEMKEYDPEMAAKWNIELDRD